mmetsp:Transcript_95521/g.308297  ORF Transcript_95521/g.308297 Transcript_95521/m.308297 type:complete len:238 (+) Transcript_95521:488-1201(+)
MAPGRRLPQAGNRLCPPIRGVCCRRHPHCGQHQGQRRPRAAAGCARIGTCRRGSRSHARSTCTAPSCGGVAPLAPRPWPRRAPQATRSSPAWRATTPLARRGSARQARRPLPTRSGRRPNRRSHPSCTRTTCLSPCLCPSTCPCPCPCPCCPSPSHGGCPPSRGRSGGASPACSAWAAHRAKPPAVGVAPPPQSSAGGSCGWGRRRAAEQAKPAAPRESLQCCCHQRSAHASTCAPP